MSATVAAKSAVEIINFDRLLSPIGGDNPAGENLQYSGVYDEIREARRADEVLTTGESQANLKIADWRQTVALSIDALTTRSKDLQICVWLVEALVKLQGFPGLNNGLKLTRELMTDYWQHLYPEIEDDDLEGRANTLAWLDRQLAIAVKQIPVTAIAGGVAYSYLQWEESKQFEIPEDLTGMDSDDLKPINELRERAAAEGKITSEQWRSILRATNKEYFETLALLLNDCWNEFNELDRVMDEKFAAQTPGMGALKKSLDDVRTLVDRLLKEKRQLEPQSVGEILATNTATETATSGPSTNINLSVSGAIKSRDEALKRLAEIAQFFHQTEPHSPVSYLVERAVKWGRMPLDKWLEDVIKNSDVIGQVRETLGISLPPES